MLRSLPLKAFEKRRMQPETAYHKVYTIHAYSCSGKRAANAEDSTADVTAQAQSHE